ncbi:MAG TPA: CbtB-domain containing protein [Rhodobacteraceae bacterium]|nr:CbtB-domain containing protein [Paracoccaceae bacterium]
MTVSTQTQEQSTAGFGLLPILAAVATGVFILYFTGFAQAAQYHDSAHDTRHTLAFPCH